MIMKKMFFLAGIFLFLAAAVVTAQSTGEASNASSDVTQRAVFQVENLTCGACFSKINSALGPLEGFSGMGANMLRNLVAVDFMAPLTPEEIGAAITGLGYPATLDSVEPLSEKQTFAYMKSQRKGAGYGSGGCCGGRSAPAAPASCPGGGQGGCGLPSAAPSNTAKDI
jgi:copper chaperone CopZ